MAGNNDFLPFAPSAANVDSQSSFASGSSYRVNGFSPGLAVSAQANKTWRQALAMSNLIGSFISGQNFNANDDGNASELLSSFQSALSAFIAAASQGTLNIFTTGDIKPTAKQAADSGWVMLKDGSIGDASSAATEFADPSTQALFTLLWNNFSNTNCPVSGGRGVSAGADYAAHKTINLPLFMGRVVGTAGQGSGLTLRNLGDFLGEEAHSLSSSEGPNHFHTITNLTTGTESSQHNHNYNPGNTGGQGAASGGSTAVPGSSTTGVENQSHFHIANGNTDFTGSATPHNTMQPTVFVNYMIKL